MSETDNAPGGIEDESLPDELQPTDENPLARDLDPDDEQTRSLDDLEMDGGKTADETPDDEPDGDDGDDETDEAGENGD